jgi:flagellar biosynthesis GTPase FlhF
MPDETTVATKGETRPGQDAGQPAGGQVDPGVDGDDASEQDAVDAAAALKKALQAERKRANEAERKVKAADDAKLSETERLTKRVQELEAAETEARRKVRDYETRDAVIEAAEAARARSPRRVYQLIRHDLTYDDDGQPTNLRKAIADAKAEFPELFLSATGSADGGAGTSGKAVGHSMNDMIRQAAGRR